jgi:hypothetical protein
LLKFLFEPVFFNLAVQNSFTKQLTIYMKFKFLSIPFLLCSLMLQGQTGWEGLFSKVELHTDTLAFNSTAHTVVYNNEHCLFFIYHEENAIAEISLFPLSQTPFQHVKLLPSGDFDMVDSMQFYDSAWHCKIKFHNLTRVQFLKLQVQASTAGGDKLGIIRLLPCTHTTVNMKPNTDELLIGEEKVFDLVTNNSDNLRCSTDWTSGLPIDYRIEKAAGQFRLHVMPNELGIHPVRLLFETEKPWVDMSNNRIIAQPLPVEYAFNVKNSGLRYLNTDKREITLDENTRRQGAEIMIDNARSMELNKTYRIEDQVNPGGTLIAELYTRSLLATNKVLCYLRTYNYHRTVEGYLYIKNGDEALFMTNLNITPAMSISKVSLMRPGGEWISDLSVYPGETVQLKINGLELNKSKFQLEEVSDITRDTLIQSDQEVNLKFQIPINISKKRIALYNNATPTDYALNVREYEIARPFDYIYVNYGDVNHTLSTLHGPVLFDKTVRDVVISFNTNKIDSDNKLYGRQNLTIDVRVTGPNSELIDMRTISNIIVCPADNSPRYKYYDQRNCSQNEISLNKFLRRSTNDLDDWSRIYLSVKSTSEKSNGDVQQKELEIILKKKTKFDIDVSFPAGLVTVSKDGGTPDKTSFSNLYGISMAMVAQFAFYNPDKIAKLRPYRVGAGFVALDAFNFQSQLQDLAMVALVSLYPTTRDKKLAFPLYLGGGYQFKAHKWMMLIGPGISVKL